MNKYFIRRIRNIQGCRKDLNKWWRRVVNRYQFLGYDENNRLTLNGYETEIKITSPRLVKKHLEAYLWSQNYFEGIEL